MPANSYCDYARIMLALPGSAVEVAKRAGMNESATRRILRQFWLCRLVHPGDVKLRSGGAQTIWHAGEGAAHEKATVIKPKRVRSGDVTFAVLWRSLEDGGTVTELARRTGMSKDTIFPVLYVLRSKKAAYVCGWEEFSRGRRAIWTLGEGKDVPKPAPRGLSYRRRAQLMATGILTRLGAANQERQAACQSRRHN